MGELTLKEEKEMMLRVIKSRIPSHYDPNGVIEYLEKYLDNLVKGTIQEVLEYCEESGVNLNEATRRQIDRINPLK
jgi:hypothetical protein